ncbi:Fe2+-dependent dioxygenase [Terriglobus saanensis]|uniref:2OG-Fe(II) oxygenase n=1 Tax=Terriglobus saanensis (strain ATCC BAA-1853 / DSM 23119 / SP1PR4) TaxID=401053 RepID=E8UXN8_TERSS|nr:Fe2+-dependent dioxygenase [Terriglobus saanensis]ADV81982.1 2OG-Fe(II) oxygenase [Terriglobus saanensis SP1PR4]
MLIQIPNVFTSEQVKQIRAALDAAEWVDGKVTAGHQSALTKQNAQIPENNPTAQQIGDVILKALGSNNLFRSAALPLKVFPPLFNRYAGGQNFGTHVDNAIRTHGASGQRIRTDLSCTLFFSDPSEYDGGELVVQDTYGDQRVKLEAGSMILYPSTSLHHVTPVTRGARVSSFFWLQSMIRSDEKRSILFELDQSIQTLAINDPSDATVVRLTGVYHNLLRQWAEM